MAITPGNPQDLVGAALLRRHSPIPQRLLAERSSALLRRHSPIPQRLRAERSSDARKFREGLRGHGCEPVIPPTPRTPPHGYDKQAYKARHLIEGMFGRLKDVRRIATRYDKRAAI